MTPEPQDVTAQKAKTVGDGDVRKVEAQVNEESVAAQVVQPRESDPKQVPVHETYVATDEVITDPSSKLAVQVPDAGRGSLDLPIHDLGGPTVEEVFAEEASEADESE